MKNLFSLLIVLLFSSTILAQINYPNEQTMLLKTIDNDADETVEGSPLLLEEFNEGRIFLKNQNEPQTYLLNYDAHTKKILFKKEDKIYYASNEQLVDKMEVNNITLVNKKYTDGDEVEKNFLIELLPGNVSLYKSLDVKYLPKREARNTYDSGEPAKYVKLNPKYYVSVGDETATLIKNKKSLLDKFNEIENLKSYIKKEKLNIKEDKDFIKIVEYINKVK